MRLCAEVVMRKKIFTQDDAKAELSRAKELSAARADVMGRARKIVKLLEKEELMDEKELNGMSDRLRKDEISLAKMLKPASKLGKNAR